VVFPGGAGLVVVAAVLLGGCAASGTVAAAGSPEVVIAEADQDLLGPWTDVSGQVLPDGTSASNGVLVVATSYGSTTCTERNGTVFLRPAWPVGTQVDVFAGEERPGNTLEFIRDSTGPGLEVYAESDLDVTLPNSARPTGFQRHGYTISVDAGAKTAYVTRTDGTTERWARLRPSQGCA
jgi:hypothetical protein